MSEIKKLSAIVFLATLATACGGGGGGGGNSPAALSEKAEINAQNAEEIAGEVVDGVLETASLGEFGELGGLSPIAASPGGSLSKSAAIVAMKSGEARARAMPGMLQAAFGPERLDCANGGSVTVSANLRENDRLSSGDNFTLSFENCDDGEGEAVSGRVTLRVNTFEGDFLNGTFAITATLDFSVLTIEEQDDSTTVNGDIVLSLDTMNYPIIVASHTSDSFDVSEDNETLVFANWSTVVNVDESSQPASYTLTGNGSIDVPRFGSVTYETREAFFGYGEGDPESGVLYIEGGEGANITITALSSTEARLEMDYDGDGVVDEVAILTWIELDD